MKYPRTARIFRGQLDVAPFAGVFFLLLLFVLLASRVYTPGVRIELPRANNLSAPDKPTIAVAVDADGQYFFENKRFEPAALQKRLAELVASSSEPPALLVRADRNVTQETWLKLMKLAQEAGIREAWQATLPRLFDQKTAPGESATLK